MFAIATLVTLVNQVSGTPYISGGDSPAGTDCSGLVSWVTNAATGRPVYGDRINTGNIERALRARGFQYGTQPGSYAALGRLPNAVRVEVLAEQADGTRTVVSHFNKAHKGRFARALATTRSEPDDAAAVATVARRAGLRVDRRGNQLTVVVPV